MREFTIGELSRRSGVVAETIRYFEKIGNVPECLIVDILPARPDTA